MRDKTAEELGLYDTVAETVIIASLLKSENDAGTVFGILGETDADVFSDLPKSLIFEAARNLYGRGQPITPGSIAAETRVAAGKRKLKTVGIVTTKMVETILAAPVDGKNMRAHIDQLRTLRELRRYSPELEKIIGQFADRQSLGEIVPSLIGLVSSMTTARSANSRVIMGYDTPDYIDLKLAEAAEGKIKLYEWPWKAFYFVEPLVDTLMAYFAGPDGHGKSAMAETFADFQVRECGVQVAYIYTEYGDWFMQARRLTRMTGIKTTKILRNQLSIDERKLIDEAKYEIREVYAGLHYVRASGRTPREVIGDMHELANRGTKLFILDYIQDMDPESSRDDRNAKSEKAAMAIHHALADMDVAAVVLAQGNKEILEANGGNMTRKMIDLPQKALSKAQYTVMMSRKKLTYDGEDHVVDRQNLIVGTGRKGGLSRIIDIQVDKQTLGDGGEAKLYMQPYSNIVTDLHQELAIAMNYNYWDHPEYD